MKSMVMSRLLPKNHRFEELFAQQARIGAQAALELQALLGDLPRAQERLESLHTLEREGDRLGQQIVGLVAQSFIVPFDREDILRLSDHLDDVIDDIEESARKLAVYRVQQPHPVLLQLAGVIVAQTAALSTALPLLGTGSQHGELRAQLQRVRELEHEADELDQQLQTQVYDGVTTVPEMIIAMRLSEISALMERASDQAQRVAKIIESILLKNA
jgi:uncharacterized protein